ncbi:protein Iojap-related, mitochondrial [Gossypium australe]|uniref:Protein Iojap-related, mitochondrial n=1 Tax=Gossypium australe TaxID=47621 RepID=A0A5B6U3T9_9ROSI|nr:protein Iojap-related, mitochondrial [Gossypium australe]
MNCCEELGIFFWLEEVAIFSRVIVHALDEKARAYYNLENLWTAKSAQKEPVEELTKAFVKVRRINNSKKPAQGKGYMRRRQSKSRSACDLLAVELINLIFL